MRWEKFVRKRMTANIIKPLITACLTPNVRLTELMIGDSTSSFGGVELSSLAALPARLFSKILTRDSQSLQKIAWNSNSEYFMRRSGLLDSQLLRRLVRFPSLQHLTMDSVTSAMDFAVLFLVEKHCTNARFNNVVEIRTDLTRVATNESEFRRRELPQLKIATAIALYDIHQTNKRQAMLKSQSNISEVTASF